MRDNSKRYQEAKKFIEKGKLYGLREAIRVLKKFPKLKFDQTVDISFNLAVNPKKSDQMVRGTATLPHGTGKNVRVLVFCKAKEAKLAKEAGADLVGSDELIEKIATGWTDFDCAIATPELMRSLARLGKILGPRGLMPSPKAGTVTEDVSKAVKEIKKGRIEFKMDKQGNVHSSIGKISFEENALYQNGLSLIEAVLSAKPATVKGNFFKSVTISTTMGPGIKLDTSRIK